uniref:RING-type domain-containing protein n=1 Tax=Scophthalmus maximus TaxID=52904 RepID=A0A8D3DTA7_SCOMX
MHKNNQHVEKKRNISTFLGAMAESDFYTEHLTCGLCLSIFTDPVTLLCGHSFCRRCITGAVNTRGRCPQCGTAVAPGQTCLPTNHILKSLGEKAREAGRKATQRGHESAEVCFSCGVLTGCQKQTDPHLACIICRDGENHQGHKFKPIKEVAASLRKKLEAFVKRIADDIDNFGLNMLCYLECWLLVCYSFSLLCPAKEVSYVLSTLIIHVSV